MSSPPLAALAAALNRAIRLDPEAPAVLAPLADRRVRVTLTGVPALDVLLTVDGPNVVLEPAGDRPADVTLTGTAPALLALLRRPDTMPASAGVTVAGDLAVLERLREALARLQPDWEEPLARVVGDELAHPLTRGIRALAAGVGRAARELEADVGEYLREESTLLAGGDQVQDFAAAVDGVRDAVDRLEKRIEALERRR